MLGKRSMLVPNTDVGVKFLPGEEVGWLPLVIFPQLARYPPTVSLLNKESRLFYIHSTITRLLLLSVLVVISSRLQRVLSQILPMTGCPGSIVQYWETGNLRHTKHETRKCRKRQYEHRNTDIGVSLIKKIILRLRNTFSIRKKKKS